MTDEHVINSLLTEIQTGKLSYKSALEMAYGAGFDKGSVNNFKGVKRPIEQYNEFGVLLNTYPSIMEAERDLSIKRQNILACLRGNRHSTKGFHWKYKNAA